MSRIVTTPEHAVPHDLARHELRVQAVTVGVADVALAVLQPGPAVVTPIVTCYFGVKIYHGLVGVSRVSSTILVTGY